MIQKKYLCKDIASAEDAIGKISGIVSSTQHKSALLTFYEKGFTRSEIESLTEKIRSYGHSELQIAGISLTLIAELMPEGTGILFNLILTKEADIEVLPIPCIPGDECMAAGKLRNRLFFHDDVRAVELFGSNMALNTTCFIEHAMEDHQDVVLFGTSTIRNLMQKVSVEGEDNSVKVSHIEDDPEQNEFIYANEIMYDGFVAVIFSGKDLKCCSNYALGWNPIGRRFKVTLGDDPSKGESVVTELNGLPAVDIYKEYLGVYPDPYFISNICEFPLVVERDGINICLIPLEYGPDGELYFMMTVRDGERLRFSFASHDEVLNASRQSLEKMEHFGPEALFLTLCGNRINFLNEDAHIEWDDFNVIAPDYALMHGACELYYLGGKGGILNSAHLAIGFKEGDDDGTVAEYEHQTLESMRQGRTLSLSDRMSTFLGKITSELRDLAEDARDANNAKSAFLSHMSHEIRTPINVILGMDEMIIEEGRDEQVLDYAESIRSAGHNLLGLVNDILDFSKIEAGKMNIIPAQYEISSVINDLYNVVRLRALDKGLEVKMDIDPTLPSILFGDETRIKQVATNILTNAVKYTESGSVTLCIKRITDIGATDPDELAKSCPDAELPDKSVKLRISVKDTGIGIKSEDIDKLFDEYERFDEKRNRKIEGTGLGLSITTQLLQLMGSTLLVESTYGKGSEFCFEIAQGVVKEDPIGDLAGKLRNPVTKKKRLEFTAEDARILVVDDFAVNLSVVKNLLKKTRINVDTATSGQEAIDLVRKNEYDVIFLDHLMPEMDGPETLFKMRAMTDNRSADTPVISLTANAVSGAREEYLKAGFRDYLSKPIDIKELEDMLFKYIPPEKIRTVTSE